MPTTRGPSPRAGWHSVGGCCGAKRVREAAGGCRGTGGRCDPDRHRGRDRTGLAVIVPGAGAGVGAEAAAEARDGGLLRTLSNHSGWLVLVPALALLLAGTVAAVLGDSGVRDGCWLVAGLIGLASSTVAVVRGLAHRTGGVDILALLAVAGAIWTGEYLAAALIAVMVGTGTVLDQWAESAAHRELSLLVARSPRVAHRIDRRRDARHRDRRGAGRGSAARRLRGDRPSGCPPAGVRHVRRVRADR